MTAARLRRDGEMSMTARLFVLCLACLFATPAAADDDGRGECRASPDYSCLIAYALATAESDINPHSRVSALLAIGKAQASAGDPMGALETADRIEDPYLTRPIHGGRSLSVDFMRSRVGVRRLAAPGFEVGSVGVWG